MLLSFYILLTYNKHFCKLFVILLYTFLSIKNDYISFHLLTYTNPELLLDAILQALILHLSLFIFFVCLVFIFFTLIVFIEPGNILKNFNIIRVIIRVNNRIIIRVAIIILRGKIIK